MKKIKILDDFINKELKGAIFVRGDIFNGVPDFERHKHTTPEFWYWEEGVDKSKNSFLPVTCFIEKYRGEHWEEL